MALTHRARLSPTYRRTARIPTSPVRHLGGGYNQGMFNVRTWNIALRTAHIAAMGVLLGGHAFDLRAKDLLPVLWLTIGTGVGLGMLEAGPSLLWFHQGRGLMTLAKLALLCAVPFLWGHWHVRLAVLLAVVAIASVGSHMPARLRYYSVIYRQVIPDRGGPGAAALLFTAEDAEGAEEKKE